MTNSKPRERKMKDGRAGMSPSLYESCTADSRSMTSCDLIWEVLGFVTQNPAQIATSSYLLSFHLRRLWLVVPAAD